MNRQGWALLAAALTVTGLWTVTVGAGVKESVQPNCAPDTVDCPPSTTSIAPQGWMLIVVGSLLLVSGGLSVVMARRTPPPPPR